jgi:hypothetical protein
MACAVGAIDRDLYRDHVDGQLKLAFDLASSLFCSLPFGVFDELAPVSLDTTLSTGTEKEWPS